MSQTDNHTEDELPILNSAEQAPDEELPVLKKKEQTTPSSSNSNLAGSTSALAGSTSGAGKQTSPNVSVLPVQGGVANQNITPTITPTKERNVPIALAPVAQVHDEIKSAVGNAQKDSAATSDLLKQYSAGLEQQNKELSEMQSKAQQAMESGDAAMAKNWQDQIAQHVEEINKSKSIIDGLTQKKSALEEQQKPENYWSGIPSELNKALAGSFRTLDNASKYLEEATGGVLTRGGLFGGIADFLESKEMAPSRLPNTLTGDVTKGLVHVVPLMIELAATPEASVPKYVETLTHGLVTKFPKMALNMGAHGFLDTYANETRFGDPLTTKGLAESVKGAAHGATEGVVMHSLGYGSKYVGDIINKIRGGELAGAAASAVLNSTGFGGLDAYNQYVEDPNKPINLRQSAVSAATGLGLESANLIGAAYGKAMRTFFDSSKEVVDLINAHPADVNKTREAAIKLGEKAAEETDPQKRGEILMAKSMLDKTADITAITKEIVSDPQKHIDHKYG